MRSNALTKNLGLFFASTPLGVRSVLFTRASDVSLKVLMKLAETGSEGLPMGHKVENGLEFGEVVLHGHARHDNAGA